MQKDKERKKIKIPEFVFVGSFYIRSNICEHLLMSINNSLNNTNTRTRIKNLNNKLLQNLDQKAVPKTYHVASKVDRIQEHRVDSTEPFTIAMVLVKFPVDYDVRCSLPNYRSHRPESCRFLTHRRPVGLFSQ